MKYLSLLILLFGLLLPVSAVRAGGICACYYNEEEYCEYFYTDEAGVEFADESECATYCDDTFGDAITQTDWADDSDSEGGISVGANCQESDNEAVAIAEATGSSTSGSSSSASAEKKSLTPLLSVDIPTVSFSEAIFNDEEGTVSVNYLGEYISGVYVYLIAIGTTIAIVMVMVSGLQWALGAATTEAVGKAKNRIKNALTGLVLLMCTYAILFIVNPNLIKLQFPELEVIPEIVEEEDDVVSGSLATSFGSTTASNIQGDGKSSVPTELIADLEAVAETLAEAGYGMSIVSSFRSVEKQKELIADNCKNPAGSDTCDPKPGRPTTCILKDLNAANCPHTTGRALDIWATEGGSQCVTQSQCSSDPSSDACRDNECQAALIEAMKAQGFCNLSSEAWHFEKPKMSSKCS